MQNLLKFVARNSTFEDRFFVGGLPFGAAFTGVLHWKRRERQQIVAGRVRKPLEQQYQESEVYKDAPEYSYVAVMRKVGQNYALDPELLRDTDRLSDLAALDSWELGSGADDLLDWLHSKGMGDIVQTMTLGDLVKALSKMAA